MKASLLLGLFLFFITTFPALAEEMRMASPGSAMKERIMEKRETLKEKREDKKEAFKKRLATFKNKVKAERVERITTIFQTINTNRTTLMLTNLEKMSEIITRLAEKVTLLEKEGKDTTAVKQTIADAKSAMATAQETVQAQAIKDYTITITSENAVKTDATNVRQTLHTDLQTVHREVVNARQAVATAIAQTKILIGGSERGK